MTFYDIYCSITLLLVNNLTTYLKVLIEYYKYLTDLVNIKILNNNEKFFLFNNRISNFSSYSYPNYISYKNTAEDKYKENLYKLRYFLMFNNIKFEKSFTTKLIYIIEKLYNKKIEFNFVNLKRVHLNSDILTQSIALKLKNRKNRLHDVLVSALNYVKIPLVTRLPDKKIEYMKKKNLNLFLLNKIRNIYLTDMVQTTTGKDFFNSILNNTFSILNDINKKKKLINKIIYNTYLQNFILKDLKHFRLAGVRLEAKGRLTKRYTAARSIYKLK
jgi:hypothetical protein